MRITGRNRRRGGGGLASPLLLFALAASAAAQSDQLDLLCTALGTRDAKAAEALFTYKTDVGALAASYQVECKAEGDELTLELTTKENGPPVIRRERVSLSLDKQGRITKFEPAWLLQRPDDTVFKPVADLAAELGDNNGPAALSDFDSGMREIGEIGNDLDALTTQTDVLCAVDIVDDNQSGDVHKLDTDWYLELKSRADAGPVERRRERVILQLVLKKKKWRITAISPVSILSPIKVN